MQQLGQLLLVNKLLDVSVPYAAGHADANFEGCLLISSEELVGGKRFGGDAEKRVESHAITRLWKLGWKEDVVDERFVRVHRA